MRTTDHIKSYTTGTIHVTIKDKNIHYENGLSVFKDGRIYIEDWVFRMDKRFKYGCQGIETYFEYLKEEIVFKGF